MGYITQALLFLVQTAFTLYLIALLLRLLLQWVRAGFHNPIAQFLVTITNPLLRPLRRVVPGFAGIDWALVVLILAVQILEIMLLALIVGAPIPGVAALLVLSLGHLLRLIIYIYIVTIIVQVVISWVNPHAYNAATVLIYSLNDPLLRPVRRLLPPLGGLDLTPLLVLIGLNLLLILLAAPVIDTGNALAGHRLF